MRQYNSYHTILKQLAHKDHLPEIYLNRIDRATLWRWKQEPEDKYTGKELSNIEVLENFISRTEAQKLMRTYLKVAFAFYAIREKILSVSLSTWYLYQKKPGIIRPALPIKKKYATGIIADRPNQVWHADITIVKTKDNIKHYVYLLMDNFSKFILSWRIESYVSGKVRMETIREAYNEYCADCGIIDLVFDGGPENNNDTIKAFVNKEEVRINPLIALKDIPYSNSVIEAQNKLFKYRYLFRQEYNDINGLRKVFGEDVNDYNYIRPHISLGGYTPFEAYSGMTGLHEQWKELIQEARRERLRVNKVEICHLCK